MNWEDNLLRYLKKLEQEKPGVICGDLNVAHQGIDLKNPGPNRGNASFSDQEREKMSELLQAGFVDTFRHLYPNRREVYTWGSYLYRAGERKVGWRIDYFIISEVLLPRLEEAKIHDQVTGSDHCPIELDLADK